MSSVVCQSWFEAAIAPYYTSTDAAERSRERGIGVLVPSLPPRQPAKLPPITLTGTHVELVPMDVDADADELFAASNGSEFMGHPRYDDDADLWRYMPRGPFRSADELCVPFRALCDAPDTRMLTVVHRASGRKVGTFGFIMHVPEVRAAVLLGGWLRVCVAVSVGGYRRSRRRRGLGVATVYSWCVDVLGHRRRLSLPACTRCPMSSCADVQD
jgi:hypothetical protein